MIRKALLAIILIFTVLSASAAEPVKDCAYLDATVRRLNELQNEHDMEAIAELCREALTAPRDTLEAYPLSYAFYDCYIHALNALGKFGDVEPLVREGQPFFEASLKPTEEEYYSLRVMEIVALTLQGRWERATARLDEMAQISTENGGVVDYQVAFLAVKINEHRTSMDWRSDADRRVETVIEIAARLLAYVPPTVPEGAREWKKFFNTVVDLLELNHYDIDSAADERYWGRMLATLVVWFNTGCDFLPGHETMAYDLALLRKNFLDYHTAHLHKLPRRWQDVRRALAQGELAVEITMVPSEILILGHDYAAPAVVAMPESIMERIDAYTPTDAVAVNEMYTPGSPLHEVVELLKPYLDGISTLYISPANSLAQFNFGAAPYGDGCLDDAVDVVQMTTTADIEHVKKHAFDFAAARPTLFGGIDYGTAKGGYAFLPHSLCEVEVIKGLFPDADLYTGSEASEERFKSIDWRRTPRVLHIATHGFSLPQPDANALADSSSRIVAVRDRTGLIMAGANEAQRADGNDGILTSREIAGLDMQSVGLAVLSSCSSGMGDIANPTGVVYGVAEAMKSSGVKHLVVTLWDVPDEASAIAMESFYTALDAGLTPRKAIKAMRRRLIAAGYTHPYYWAPFLCLE